MNKKRWLKVIVGIALAIGILYISPYGYLIKGVSLTYLKGEKSANYRDWVDFDVRDVANNPQKIQPLMIAETAKNSKKSVQLSQELRQMLVKTNSGSFLVFRNDTLQSETYFGEISQQTQTNSFSMAKTITTLLVQLAIQENIVGGWDEKVQTYLPWVTGPYANVLTLRHLSTMTAGLDWDESYVSPFGVTAKAYYSNNVEKVMREVPVSEQPGMRYEYQSGATQLLGFCLFEAMQRYQKSHPDAKGLESISAYASSRLWEPIGAEYPAFWSLDHENGRELTYCCFDATARDFAKLGLLVSNHGKTPKGDQLVDSSFLAMAQKPFKSPNYGHSFWIGNVNLKTGIPDQNGVRFTYFQGMKGQFIIMVPQYKLVIVRTGHGVDRSDDYPVFKCVRTYVKEAVGLWGR